LLASKHLPRINLPPDIMPTKQKVLLSDIINSEQDGFVNFGSVANFGNEDEAASMTLVHLSSSLSSNPRPMATIKKGENSFTGIRTRSPSSRRATSKKARTSMNSDSSENSESYTETVDEITGCKCVKSSCLKLYCTCFQQRSYCLDSCGCANCLNTSENDGPTGIRSQTIQEILQRRPDAFDKREPQVQLQACLCEKNKCVQLYCPCVANGSQCGDDCKCTECGNRHDAFEMQLSLNSSTLNATNSSISMDQIPSSDASSSSSASYKEETKAPARRYRGAVKTKGIISGCKCAKTRCLKLYCPCFEKGIVCHEGCICSNCMNTTEESGPDGIRTKAIEEILSRRPLAFDKREGDSNDIGCICKKTKCLKKYCICFSAGIKCDENKCKCKDCGNRTDDYDDEETVNKSNIYSSRNEAMGPFADLMELKCVDPEPPLMIEDPPLLDLDVVTLIEEV
ncbi:hypothetical protein ACHAWT_001902, partial [Skeletonema menzelii]